MCTIQDYDKLKLTPLHRKFVETELDLWHKYYIPPEGVEGKTILDLGAGCGETALFYLLHGAKKVICVESDKDCISLLAKNYMTNPILGNHNIQIIQSHIDFIKIDIEGSEKDMVIESHFMPYLKHLKGFTGTVTLWRFAKYEKTTKLMLFIHRLRINIAHKIRVMWDSI